MTDPQHPPTPPIKKGGQNLLQRVTIVWVVPLIAVLAVVAIAAQSYLDRGPLITVSFENASGIQPGTTELRYRDVTVGLVEDVSFADGLDRVVVAIRIDQDVAPYVDANSQFWVVRPQVTAQGVSGLNTVLSGVYLEGLWDNTPDGVTYDFAGLPDAPLEKAGQDGLRVTLRASGKATLTQNAPILYRGITVGRLGKTQITQDGSAAEAEALIYKPHDRLISSATRFWDASGFSFSLGPNGAALDFSSVASLVSGGITFETLVSGGRPVDPGASFVVHADESSARSSIFSRDNAENLTLSAVFEENVEGLTTDAAVELNGLRIGRVSALNGLVDPEAFGDNRVRLVVSLAISPGRLGLAGEASTDAALDFLRKRVAQGLRARLTTASILTGGLKVELIDVPDAPNAALETGESGALYIPTTKSDIADVSATAEGVFERINALPIEEVMAQAINLMENANTLITNEDLRIVPQTLNGLLGDVRGFVASDDVQTLPGRLNDVVVDLQATLTRLNDAQTVERLTAAVDSATEAAEGVTTAVSGVPDLIERLNAVAAKVETVEIDRLAAEFSGLLNTTETLLASDAAAELPAKLNSALAELSAVLAQLRDGGVVENATNALASASQAADTVAEAGRELPDLIAQAKGVLARANSTLEGYEASNGLGRDARTALIEVQKAAKAVASLARAIERNPNSLLTGR